MECFDVLFFLADAPEHNYLFSIPALALLGTYGYGLMHFAPAALEDVHQAAYLASSLCCIAAITALASQKTSRLGRLHLRIITSSPQSY